MAKKTTILRIALPTLLRRLFDYLPPQDIDQKALIPGVRISVPFQSRTLVGILIEVTTESSVPYEKLKSAHAILDTAPLLPPDMFQLCQWAADYYHYAMGEVLAGALPTFLRKGKEVPEKIKLPAISALSDVAPILNAAQQTAIEKIIAAKKIFRVFLLDGVTGSGKTEVYLHAIKEILADEKQVLVLVPEISLTPQTIERFRARFQVPVVALHSGLTEQARLHGWLAARTGAASIIIGTRSAVFTSFANLGLIIVDEEHDTSFKQQDRFRYHARDLAVMRASIQQIPIVLGSATPSLESLQNAKRERYEYLNLPERAGTACLPVFQVINLQQHKADEGLSMPLVNAIREHLAQDNQVMLFLNRRGFAPVLYCTSCTWIAPCKRCDVRMVYHRKPLRLHCHHCDAQTPVPACCPECKMSTLEPVGLGTQRLEQVLQTYFPDVPILRVDRDNTRRKGTMDTLLEQINTNQKAILLGTQMLAKGHHFPNVTLVGIVDADNGLFSADFRAAEQMGQLLLQVAGRAGRAEKNGTVLIQTRYPDHPLLQILIQQGYTHFSDHLLAERQQALLPPFAHFAIFRAEAYEEQQAVQFLTKIKDICLTVPGLVEILGPVPALIAKRKGLHCQHLLLKAENRGPLQDSLKNLLKAIEKFTTHTKVKWTLDVDPVEV